MFLATGTLSPRQVKELDREVLDIVAEHFPDLQI